ncbi:MAG: ATP-binding protein [Bryobacteraceae bacterium]|nr:ATP-binding protein [Bryobacteraceae bacterium]
MSGEAVCPICNGTGFRIIEREGVTGADRCTCAAQERARSLEAQAGIPTNYSGASFDTFRLPDNNPVGRRELAEVLWLVRTYAREYPVLDKPGLLLIGEPGTGKTHLAVSAFRAILAKGFEGVFFDYQNLLDCIRASYDEASKLSNRDAYRDALEAGVLLLDDLGAHRVTEWTEDIVTSIITYRCNHRKTLIATSNLPDPDAGSAVIQRNASTGKVDYRATLADKIGARARSRLFEMCRVVQMPAVADYRVRSL